MSPLEAKVAKLEIQVEDILNQGFLRREDIRGFGERWIFPTWDEMHDAIQEAVNSI